MILFIIIIIIFPFNISCQSIIIFSNTGNIQYTNDTLFVPTVSGQSNGVAQVLLDSVPTERLRSQHHINIIQEGNYLNYDTNNTNLVQYDCPENTRYYIYTDPENAYYTQTGYGAEFESSTLIRNNHLKIPYVLKSAEGALTIDQWTGDNTRWNELRRYYEYIIDYASNNNKPIKLLPLLWLQGESNIAGSSTDDYGTELIALVDKVRSISDETDSVEFIFCKIPAYNWGRDGTLEVNRKFDSVAGVKWGCHVMETWDLIDSYSALGAGGHYSYSGINTIGNRYYDKIVELGYLTKVQDYLPYPTLTDTSSLPAKQVVWTSLSDATADTNTIDFTSPGGVGVSTDTVSRDSIILQFYIPSKADVNSTAIGLKNSSTPITTYLNFDYIVYMSGGYYQVRVDGVDINTYKIIQDYDKLRFRIEGDFLKIEVLHEFYEEYGGWSSVYNYNLNTDTYYIQALSVSSSGKIINVLYE